MGRTVTGAMSTITVQLGVKLMEHRVSEDGGQIIVICDLVLVTLRYAY